MDKQIKSNYCTECGTRLTYKFLKNEGNIPFCTKCRQFRFPMFNVAVSMIVVDETKEKILLIKQYSRDFYVLVAGYVNRGEAAERAVIREVKEETGLDVKHISFNRTKFYEPSNTLMVNFTAFVDSDKVTDTEEVDHWEWFTFAEARENIRHGSLAEEFLDKYLDSI